MDLRIAHLYPDLMSIYGDRGNVIALEQRARWRGIDVETRAYTAGDAFDAEWPDLFFFGGGQDQGQDVVGRDLAGANGDALRRAVAGGAAVLAICGGYQLLGHEYVPETGPAIPGVGVLDVTTRAGKRRFVGNLVAEAEGVAFDSPGGTPNSPGGTPNSPGGTPDSPGRTLVGFENHSGRTYLGHAARPLGRVVIGHGNNGEDKTEGAVQGKIVGCYIHGSLLPKNPWLADRMLALALARRHGEVTLAPLDDTAEAAAHDSAIEVARSRP